MRRISALYPPFSPTIQGFVRVFTVSVRHVACARPSVYNLRCHRGGLSSRATSKLILRGAHQALPTRADNRTKLSAAQLQSSSRAISRTILQNARKPLPTRTSNRSILPAALLITMLAHSQQNQSTDSTATAPLVCNQQNNPAECTPSDSPRALSSINLLNARIATVLIHLPTGTLCLIGKCAL